ncbi:MAG: potassium transporter TrkA [Marinilabiliales bacterium]|nr:MAG: potassium transporter TrkA [Marinilabiliales bacterium]
MGKLIIVLISFVWVVIASSQVAKFFQKIRLPLITGFLFSGILIGPYGLDLVHAESIPNLDIVNYTSLAFIAFAAGAELYLKEIRNSIKSIVWNTVGQLIITFLLGSVTMYFIADMVPFMNGMSHESKIAVAILTGTIFVARSPSSAIAVINEMRAKGPFTKTAISVTVIKDVLVIFLFTICLAFANTLIHNTDFGIFFIFYLIISLIITLGLGYLIAKFIELLLLVPISIYIKSMLILVSGFAIYELSHFIRDYSALNFPFELLIEPLLVCIVASFWITNYTKVREDFYKVIEDAGPMVYAAFFTLTGAAMSIDILIKTWTVALLIFFVRLIAMVIGSFIGGYLAKDPKLHRRLGWMPYVTQAGVGLALAFEVAGDFPDWGMQFATIIIAVIVLNQIIGPPLFKWSIKLVGESHLALKGNEGTHRTALIFGLEHHSLRLARDLQKEHYSVEIASIERRKNISHIKDVKIHFLEDLNVKCLHSINIKKFHTIILMLSDGENYKACKLLFNNFETKVVVVRLFDSIYSEKFLELGALVVDPATAITKLIEQFVRSPIAGSLILGDTEQNAIVDIKIRDKNLHGIALRDLRLPPDTLILAVKRKGQMLISHGYTRLRKGDIVTMVGSMESLEDISLQFEE